MLAVGCRKEGVSDQGQIGAAVGDVMASADESANGGATTAMLPALPVPCCAPAELRPPLWRRTMDALTLIPPAYADSCLPVTYSACNAGVRTATFNGCTVGAIAVDGSVNLTFSDTAACNIATVGDSVNRTGSLTLSAPAGSLAITTPGGGQTLTRTAERLHLRRGGDGARPHAGERPDALRHQHDDLHAAHHHRQLAGRHGDGRAGRWSSPTTWPATRWR